MPVFIYVRNYPGNIGTQRSTARHLPADAGAMIQGQITWSDAPRCHHTCPSGKQSSPETAGFRRSSPRVPVARCWPSPWGSALRALTPLLGMWIPLQGHS